MKILKRLLMCSALILMFSTAARAQFFWGASFDVKYHNNTENGGKNDQWSVVLDPNIGYHITERLETGSFLGLNFSNSLETHDKTNYRAYKVGWDVTPFVRYKVLSFNDDKVSIWVDAHLYCGMEFPQKTQVVGSVSNETESYIPDTSGEWTSNFYKHQVNYGIQVLPMVSFRLTERYRLNVHFSIASLGYSGSATFRNDGKVDFSNDVLMFTGKISGLASSVFTTGMYGIKIGIGRNF